MNAFRMDHELCALMLLNEFHLKHQVTKSGPSAAGTESTLEQGCDTTLIRKEKKMLLCLF